MENQERSLAPSIPSVSRSPKTRTPRTTSEFIRHKRRREDATTSGRRTSPRLGNPGRRLADRMPDSQPAPSGGSMLPISALLSPGDPPSVFVHFTRPEEVRGAIHGEAPNPRCLVQGVKGLNVGQSVATAFQLPSMAFVQFLGEVLAVDGDRATLQLSSQNPEDIANLLQAGR
jgi:hypothetical protein